MSVVNTGPQSSEPFERVELAEDAPSLAKRITALREGGVSDEAIVDALTGRDRGGAAILTDDDQSEIDRLLTEWEERRR